MSKKNIYLIIALAVGVFGLLIGFIYFFNSVEKRSNAVLSDKQTSAQNGVSASAKPLSPTSQTPGNKPVSGQALTPAQKSNDPEDCYKESNVPNFTNICLHNLAVYRGDVTDCAKIADLKAAQYCADQLTYNAAIASMKISSCLQIKSTQLHENCVENIISQQPGLKRGDCDALPDQDKGHCLDHFNFVAIMSQLNGAQSAADCRKITEAGTQEECLKRHPE
jgi:hypothetical protein